MLCNYFTYFIVIQINNLTQTFITFYSHSNFILHYYTTRNSKIVVLYLSINILSSITFDLYDSLNQIYPWNIFINLNIWLCFNTSTPCCTNIKISPIPKIPNCLIPSVVLLQRMKKNIWKIEVLYYLWIRNQISYHLPFYE